MSISDFTLSSPRKGGRREEKSITYDEEFEKFLNDTSESELSSNRHKKKADKPWWMNDDKEDDDNIKKSSSLNNPKSFLKSSNPKPKNQTSSTKLATTLESEEFENDFKENYQNKTNRNSFSNKYSDDFGDENKDNNLPKLSLDNNSTNSSTLLSNFKQKKPFDKYDEISNVDEEAEEDRHSKSSDNQSSSRNSQPSVIHRKIDQLNETQNKKNDMMSTNNQTNLLSKVMFMDTLGSNTLIPSGTGQLNQTVSSGGNGNNGGLLKTATQKQVNFSNTETRRDLDDLANEYRNLANFTDSGLNTLIKTTTMSNNEVEEPQKNENKYLQALNESNNDQSIDIMNSEFGLKAIKVVTEELENRTFQKIMQVLNQENNDINKKMFPNKSNNRNQILKTKTKGQQPIKAQANDENGWPPKKYGHIKGSGYGTSWSPKPVKKSTINSSNTSLNKSFDNSNQNRFKSAKRINKSLESIDSNDYFENYSSKPLMSNDEIIDKLQDQLIRTTNEYETKINRLKKYHEDKLNNLRKEIVDLNSKLEVEKKAKENRINTYEDLNDINEKENKKPVRHVNDQKKLNELEEKIQEQEKLIKGYQYENEKLYNELKLEKNSKPKQLIEARNLNIPEFMFASEKTPTKKESRGTSPPKQSQNIIKSSVQINEYNDKIENLESKLKELTSHNSELIKRVEYYEKNQQQIELDIKIIDQKNKDIKLLNEKLTKLESNRSAPECLKEIKRLKNQLKEMDIVIKRLRNNNKDNPNYNNPAVSLSIDYYEKRIEQLEVNLKEKALEVERVNRMWIQKFDLNKKIYEEHIKSLKSDDKDDEISLGLLDYDRKIEKNMEKDEHIVKIEKLENLNTNLRKLLDEFELRCNEKDIEIHSLKKKYEFEINKSTQSSHRLLYEPTLFAKHFNEDEIKLSMINDVFKENYAEMESLKLKLTNSQNELKLKSKDYEHEIDRLKLFNDQKLTTIMRKHKQEINKLLSLLSDININDYDDNESILDDPVKFRILTNKLDNLNTYKTKCQKLELINRTLNENFEKLKFELNSLKYNSGLNNNNINNSANNEKINNLIKHYEMQLEFKNNQIIKFRNEMDNMLILLKTLQTT